jgi:hypothetical protein
MKVLIFSPLALFTILLAIELYAEFAGWKLPPSGERRVISGEHTGLSGRVVSLPWIGNWYNSRVCLNVPGKDDRRDWIWVWKNQTEQKVTK